MKLSRLEELWTSITNTTLPRKPAEVAEHFQKCQSLLESGLTCYTRLEKREATGMTSDDVVKALRKTESLRRDVADEDLEDFASILTDIVHTLYLDLRPASELMERCVLAMEKTMKFLLTMSTDAAVDCVLNFYFQQRRWLFAVHRYIQETLRSLDGGKMNPFHGIFRKISEDVLTGDFFEGLLGEFGFSLGLLKDYVENPSVELQRMWLSLQLQDFRLVNGWKVLEKRIFTCLLQVEVVFKCFGQLLAWSIDWLMESCSLSNIILLLHVIIDWLIDWVILDESFQQAATQPIDWLIDWSIDWVFYWYEEALIYWLSNIFDRPLLCF